MKSKLKHGSCLRLATQRDLPVIDRWLVRPEIRRWWGSPIDNQCEMRLGIFCHDEIGHVFLILDQNARPVGLVSVIHARAVAGSRVSWSPLLPGQSWEIGILIADKRHRRRGLGVKALTQAQINLAAHSTDPVFAWIYKNNAASLATFSRLGYQRVLERETADFSSALFRYDH